MIDSSESKFIFSFGLGLWTWTRACQYIFYVTTTNTKLRCYVALSRYQYITFCTCSCVSKMSEYNSCISPVSCTAQLCWCRPSSAGPEYDWTRAQMQASDWLRKLACPGAEVFWKSGGNPQTREILSRKTGRGKSLFFKVKQFRAQSPYHINMIVILSLLLYIW